MKSLIPAAFAIMLTASGAVLASDDCRRPMAEWQSRDAVAAYVAGFGITTDRLRIDEGCYKIRGRDEEGNRVELKIDPTSFAVLRLEVRFRPGADSSRYLSVARDQPGANGTGETPAGRPSSPSTRAPQSGAN